MIESNTYDVKESDGKYILRETTSGIGFYQVQVAMHCAVDDEQTPPPEEGVLSVSAPSSSNKNCTQGHENMWAQVATL